MHFSRRTILIFAATALGACGGPPGGVNVGEREQPIINGTVESAENSGYVLLSVGCSGTLVTNNWILSARHCFAGVTDPTTVSVTMGSQSQTADQIARHATADVALVHVNSPFTMGGSTSGYSKPLYWGTSAMLAGATLSCDGYGNDTFGGGFGTLRHGDVPVGSADTLGDGYRLSPSSTGQIPWKGDSGSSCSYGGMITGVQSSCVSSGTSVLGCYQEGVATFRDWMKAVLGTSGSDIDVHSTNFIYDHHGPFNFTFGDVALDRLSEMIMYIRTPDGFRITVVDNEFATGTVADLQENIGGYESPITVFAIHNDTNYSSKQEVCVFTSFGNVRCYDVDPIGRTLNLKFTQSMPSGWTLSSKFAVGDFDGDGQQELLVYDYNCSVPPVLYKYSVLSNSFIPSWSNDLGNLGGFSWPGGVRMFVANVVNNSDDTGPKDDIVVFNESTRQIGTFVAHRDPSDGNSTFWWWYTTGGGTVAANEEVTIGDFDGDRLDDIALHDLDAGGLRFFSGQPQSDGSLTPMYVNRGQLPYHSERAYLVWAKVANFAEPANTWYRSDAMYYLESSAQLSRDDARFDGSSATWWWAYNKAATAVMNSIPW